MLDRTGSVHDELTLYYKSIAPQLLAALPSGRQISSPLFVSVEAGYESAPCRLMIVGQETHSWYGLVDELKEDPDPVAKMQSRYEEFDLGRDYKKSSFCSVMHDLQKKLEPFVPRGGFVWTNLFPCDEGKKTPTNEIGDMLRSFRVLPNEMRILKPDAVIFLTGPVYDYTIKALFPGCTFERVIPEAFERQLARVKHERLPDVTFRTYHPSSLRRQKKMHYIDLITKAIKNVWVAEGQPR